MHPRGSAVLPLFVVFAFAIAGCTSNSPASSQPSATQHPSLGASSGVAVVPSQTTQDAARDGVAPAVAQLSFAARVDILSAANAAQGVWVASRLPATTTGDPSTGSLGQGTYGKTRVSASEYGELLLLDRARHRILRAFPLPSLPPQQVLVTRAAVYCERQGDGGLPDSMLCRVDPKSLNWIVRIFPSYMDSAFNPVPPDRYVPSNWTIDKPTHDAMFQTIRPHGRELMVAGYGKSALVDPLTLRIKRVM